MLEKCESSNIRGRVGPPSVATGAPVVREILRACRLHTRTSLNRCLRFSRPQRSPSRKIAEFAGEKTARNYLLGRGYRVFEAVPSKIHAGGACNRSKARINAAASENTRPEPLVETFSATLRSFQAPSLSSSRRSGEEKGADGRERGRGSALCGEIQISTERSAVHAPLAKPVSPRSSPDSPLSYRVQGTMARNIPPSS